MSKEDSNKNCNLTDDAHRCEIIKTYRKLEIAYQLSSHNDNFLVISHKICFKKAREGKINVFKVLYWKLRYLSKG